MRIPIVDENDNILYYKDSKERDLRKEVTRVAVLWIFNERKEILIARRSKKKKHHPDLWGPSVAGSVEEGETYESNIIKEADEEIGLSINTVTLGPKLRISGLHEYFTQWFFTKVSSGTKFVPRVGEVDEVQWATLTDLKKKYEMKPEEFLPRFKSYFELLENYENKS